MLRKLREMKLGAHIDHAHSISIGRLGETYYLMIVIDGIVSTIRFDDASEFGKSSSFIAYCTQHVIVREPVSASTHDQNARAEGAIRICKEHVRCLLRSANLPRRF